MMLKTSMLAAVTAVLSFVSIPLPLSPVPLTGQTLGVSLSGLLLGPWWGAASMAVYLVAGIAGFPIFAKGGSGLGTVLGPTGGYLLAFIPGAWLTGVLAFRAPASRATTPASPGTARLLAAGLAGSVLVVHLAGSWWLSWQTKRTFPQALAAGSLPFVAGDVLKVFLASLIAGRYRRLPH